MTMSPHPAIGSAGVTADTIGPLMRTAAKLRGEVIKMSHRARTPHLGSALSCIDILAAAYWAVLRIDPAAPGAADRDRFILSKGHAATALYATLATAGFFPMEELATYNRDGGRLAEHPGPGCAPRGGGHRFSRPWASSASAWRRRRDSRSCLYRVFV